MFKKYNSIENTYRKAALEQIKAEGFGGQIYVVQEKVHGANISYRTADGENYVAAKRTGDIAEGEFFFNHDKLLARLHSQFQKIWQLVNVKHAPVKLMTIFGELIGGDYAHDDVPRNKAAARVQKGIYYSPNNHFYAFDILLNNEMYLPVAEINSYFAAAEMLYAKSLFVGTLDEALTYQNDFESTIPALLGHPPIKPNVAEGVVIRPAEPLFLATGSRVFLKNKNERWSENSKHHSVISPLDSVSEQVVQLQEAILSYVTDNRLAAVVSKIGEVSQKDHGKLLGLFSKDVVEAFMKDYEAETAGLEKRERKAITKSFGKAANRLVKVMLANL